MSDLQFRVAAEAIKKTTRADALVVPLPAGKAKLDKTLTAMNQPTDGRLAELLKAGKVADKVGKVSATLGGNGRFGRVAVVSLGTKDKLSAEMLRRAGAAAAKWARSEEIGSVAVAVEPLAATRIDHAVGAWCEGVHLGGYTFTDYKSDAKPAKPIRMTLLTDGATRRREAGRAARTAGTVCDAVYLARRLGQMPANQLNPVTYAARVRRLARQHGLRCRVLDDRRLSDEGMNAMLAVGGGSATKPRLVVVEYRPSNKAGAKAKPVVLVGKGVTFDTGGYNLKPGSAIGGMKYDMMGSAVALATTIAAAELKLPTPVTAVMGLVENMISQTSYRPNDILTAMNGKTIEVLNTDAEGRLVLADALCWTCKHLKPDVCIDLATLTGAAIVVIGNGAALVMGNDRTLSDALIAAGETTYERLWPLPIWEEHREQVKGTDTDLKNVGVARQAGTIAGAALLEHFVADGVKWAHLDIAPTALADTEGPYTPKSASGFGVRLLIEYLRKQG